MAAAVIRVQKNDYHKFKYRGGGIFANGEAERVSGADKG